jgi:hypothetical protein
MKRVCVMYCHDLVVVSLINRPGFLDWTQGVLDTCRLQYLITIHSVALSPIHNYSVCNAVAITHRLYFSQSAIHSTRTESFWSAVPHWSSGTGFQRRTFPFLGSRTAPASQSHLTYSTVTNSILWRLLVTGYVPTITTSGALFSN